VQDLLKRKKIKVETKSKNKTKKKRIRRKCTFYHRTEELKDLKERKKISNEKQK
jgi:hypothetical protein